MSNCGSLPSNSAQPLTSIPRFGFIGTPTGAVAATQPGEASVPLGLPISNSTYSSASALCFGATSVPAHKTVSADNSTSTGRQAISSPKQSGIVNSNCEVGTSGVTNSPSTGYNNSGALVGHHKSVTKNNLLLPGFHQATVNRNGCLSNSATRLCRDFAEDGTKLTRPCQIPLPPADQISASKEAFVELATSRQSTTLHTPRISLLPSLSSAPDLAAFSFSSNNKHITVSKFSTTSLHQLAQIPKMASTSSASKLTTQRLIKSQSLFASLASHQNGDLMAGTNPITRSAKLSAHKSLDMVDKLVIASGMEEELSDHQTPGTLSRSSTASLGVLSNLNDVLAAADDCSDYEEDVDFDPRLAAIDESLSPLSTFSSICQSTMLNEGVSVDSKSSLDQWNDLHTTVISKNTKHANTDNTQVDHQEEISLNSINLTDGNLMTTHKKVHEIPPNSNNFQAAQRNHVLSSSQIYSEESLAVVSPPITAKFPKKDVLQFKSGNSTTARLSSPHTATYTRLPKTPTSSSIGKKDNSISKASSSKASSGTVSRTTTPTISESEFGDLNSLSSVISGVSLSKAVSSRFAIKSKATTSKLNSQRHSSNAPMRSTLNTKKSGLPTKPKAEPSLGSKTITRSSTYTRSLNSATNTRKPLLTSLKQTDAPLNKQPINTKAVTSKVTASKETRKTSSTLVPASTKSQFDKPTASYLNKTTKKTILPSSAVSHYSPRPSSVASNASSGASSHQTVASKKSSVLSKQSATASSRSAALTPGAKRSPTITLLSAAGVSSAKSSPVSSRRPSITSPSKSSGLSSSSHPVHKQTVTDQLRQYQALYWQQNTINKRLRNQLLEADIKAASLLYVNAHLINEYSPFETPYLRAELAALHEKTCTLHRDYELSKESASQKEASILLLETKLWEQSKQLDDAQTEVQSFKLKLADAESLLLSGEEERQVLIKEIEDLQRDLENEKEEHSNTLSKLNALEESCRSDKKYRDLKDKISTYQKEVDSLNVVIDMKTQRTRHLESQVMHTKLELANYENLKENYQQLQRENEALTETVGMKARKNAEQSREIDTLRSELRREANERKRTSIRNDQLEYQLNETQELLKEYTFDLSSVNEDSKEATPSQSDAPVPYSQSERPARNLSSIVPKNVSSNFGSKQTAGRSSVRRLFSTPLSRQHFHQQPTSSSAKKPLPELVLSSIGGDSNWAPSQTATSGASSSASSHYDNGQSDCHSSSKSSSNCNSANSSPQTSPKLSKSNKDDPFAEFAPTSSSMSTPGN